MLLLSVGMCVSRLLGMLDTFYLAQALSGRRCFRAYLRWFGRVVAPNYDHCDTDQDDVKHTIFSCPFLAEILTRITERLSRSQSSDNVEAVLYGPWPEQRQPIVWGPMEATLRNEFVGMVTKILSSKEEAKRVQQAGTRRTGAAVRSIQHMRIRR